MCVCVGGGGGGGGRAGEVEHMFFLLDLLDLLLRTYIMIFKYIPSLSLSPPSKKIHSLPPPLLLALIRFFFSFFFPCFTSYLKCLYLYNKKKVAS